MDWSTVIAWAAGVGGLFLAIFTVFDFFELRFIWRCNREVEKGRREFDERWRARRPSPPLSSARQHFGRARADVEAFDRNYELGRGA